MTCVEMIQKVYACGDSNRSRRQASRIKGGFKMVDYTAAELKAKQGLLEACVENNIRENECAGASLMVLKDNEEVFYFDRGYANIEEQKSITRDNIYRCYSMSKVITSAAVMVLLQDGRIDLYDPVARFFPSFAHQKVATKDGLIDAQHQMTIKDLLNMTSGLGYIDEESQAGIDTGRVYEEAIGRLSTDHQMTTEEFAEKIGHCTLNFDPGTSWKYGVSADILGAIVEKVSGMTFGEFLRKNIFDPLEMEDTGFYVPEEKKGRLVTAYGNEGKVPGAKLVPYLGCNLAIINNGDPNLFESGGAGIFSTIDDYRKFTQMLMRGGRGLNGARVLRLGTVQFMTRHGIDGAQQEAFRYWIGLEGHTYANLCRVMKNADLAGTIGRDGEYGWDGWLGTYLCNSPADGITILLMMNKEDYGTGRLTREVRNIVFG